MKYAFKSCKNKSNIDAVVSKQRLGPLGKGQEGQGQSKMCEIVLQILSFSFLTQEQGRRYSEVGIQVMGIIHCLTIRNN